MSIQNTGTVNSEFESELNLPNQKRFPQNLNNCSTMKISIQDTTDQENSFISNCQNLVDLVHNHLEVVFEELQSSFPCMASTIRDLLNLGKCTVSNIREYYTLPNGYVDTVTIQSVVDTLQAAVSIHDESDFYSDSEFSVCSYSDDYDVTAVNRGSVFENIEMVRRKTTFRDSLITHVHNSQPSLYDTMSIPEDEVWIEPTTNMRELTDYHISYPGLVDEFTNENDDHEYNNNNDNYNQYSHEYERTINGAVQFKVITSDSSDATLGGDEFDDIEFTSVSCYEQFCLADLEYLPSPPKMVVTKSGTKVEILQTAEDDYENIAMVKEFTGETSLRTFNSLYVTQNSYVDCLYKTAEAKLQEAHDSELVELCLSTFKRLIEHESYLKLVEFLGAEGRVDSSLVAGCVAKIMNDDTDTTTKPVVISAMIDLTNVAEIRRCLIGCVDMFSDCIELSGSYITPFSPFSSCSM